VLWNPIQWKWVEIPEFGVLFKKILFPKNEKILILRNRIRYNKNEKR